MASDSPEKTEKLGPNNGRTVAGIGLAMGFLAIVLILLDGLARANLVAAVVILLLMALVWSVMLRPAIFLDSTTLRLRNAFADVAIPLPAVEDVLVRQVTVVHTEGRSFHSTALTRHRRELTDRDRGKVVVDPINDYVDFAEERIRARADDARARGDAGGAPRRRPAWLEIAVVAVLAVAVVVLAVL